MKCLLHFLSLCHVLKLVAPSSQEASLVISLLDSSTERSSFSSSSEQEEKRSYTQLSVVVRVGTRRHKDKASDAKTIGLSYELFKTMGIELPWEMHREMHLPLSLTLLLDCDGTSVRHEFRERVDRVNLIPDNRDDAGCWSHILLPLSVCLSDRRAGH